MIDCYEAGIFARASLVPCFLLRWKLDEACPTLFTARAFRVFLVDYLFSLFEVCRAGVCVRGCVIIGRRVCACAGNRVGEGGVFNYVNINRRVGGR